MDDEWLDDEDEQEELPSRSDFMSGRCYDMAVALHKLTGLPLYGLYGGGECHHAFVWDDERNIGIDARGAASLDILRKGCRGQDKNPLTPDEISTCVGRPLDDAEIDEAQAFIKQDEILANAVRPYKTRNHAGDPGNQVVVRK